MPASTKAAPPQQASLNEFWAKAKKGKDKEEEVVKNGDAKSEAVSGMDVDGTWIFGAGIYYEC